MSNFIVLQFQSQMDKIEPKMDKSEPKSAPKFESRPEPRFEPKIEPQFEPPKVAYEPKKLEKSLSLTMDLKPKIETLAKSDSMPPPAGAGVGGRTKKSFFKSKGQGGSKAAYKHSFGNQETNKDEEFKAKVFHKAISMDFDDDGPGPSDMSFR